MPKKKSSVQLQREIDEALSKTWAGPGVSGGHLLKMGKRGLAEDPRGLHVMLTHQGRELLGTIKDVYRDDVTGMTRLVVRHFNGEQWPLEPAASAVRVI